MTLSSGFTETTPTPRSRSVNRRFAHASDVVQQPAGLRHAVRGQADYPLCDSTLRIVIRVTPFGPQIGGMNLRTCPRCAVLAGDELNAAPT
ncbi:hypothetical protein [Amycolatopsis sp. NPDC050768]|uniref:hypothetical protein n=1 Tax=Amycolatopsis sp. NPDC050768 TaxID=3154839 RepID=UPI0033E2F4E5